MRKNLHTCPYWHPRGIVGKCTHPDTTSEDGGVTQECLHCHEEWPTREYRKHYPKAVR